MDGEWQKRESVAEGEEQRADWWKTELELTFWQNNEGVTFAFISYIWLKCREFCLGRNNLYKALALYSFFQWPHRMTQWNQIDLISIKTFLDCFSTIDLESSWQGLWLAALHPFGRVRMRWMVHTVIINPGQYVNIRVKDSQRRTGAALSITTNQSPLSCTFPCLCFWETGSLSGICVCIFVFAHTFFHVTATSLDVVGYSVKERCVSYIPVP